MTTYGGRLIYAGGVKYHVGGGGGGGVGVKLQVQICTLRRYRFLCYMKMQIEYIKF